MSTGGAQKVLLSHCEHLVKHSHEVALISLKKSNKYRFSKKIKYIELIDFNKQITTHIFDILQEISLYAKNSDKMLYCLDNDLSSLVQNAYYSLDKYSDIHSKFENI